MESPHKPNGHRDIAAASLASLAATLVAIRAHADDVHEDTQSSSVGHPDQDDSSIDADGEHAPPTHRWMN
jgi:hypothetical protein